MAWQPAREHASSALSTAQLDAQEHPHDRDSDFDTN